VVLCQAEHRAEQSITISGVYPLVGGDCNHSNSTNQIAVFDLI
jgi:hypothetical protein